MDGTSNSFNSVSGDGIKIAHTIPLSVGQFALALAGHKKIHYIHLDTPYAEGTKLLLSCKIGDEVAYIPIVVEKIKRAPEEELTNGHLSGAGHFITPKDKLAGKVIHAHDIADNSLGNDAPIYEMSFAIDMRKDLEASDLKPQFIRQMQHEARKQLHHAYHLLETPVALAHAAYHNSLPPKDMRSDDFDRNVYFSSADTTLIETFKYLRDARGDTGLRPFLNALATPHEFIAQSIKSKGKSTGKPEKSDPTEFDGHQQELAGFTHIYTDQGSGLLTAMGLKHRIATRDPIPAPITSNLENIPKGEAVIAVNYNKDGARKILTVPIILDRTDAPTFYANQITDEIAHMHGHKNGKAMRKSLRIGENENPILYSYAYRLAAPSELIWHGQAGEDVVMNMVQSFHDIWEDSNKDSVRSAKNFIQEQVSPEDAAKGLDRITPFREIRGTEKAAGLAEVNPARNGRPAQSSVAFRRVNSVEATTIDFGPEHERLRNLIAAQKSTGRG